MIPIAAPLLKVIRLLDPPTSLTEIIGDGENQRFGRFRPFLKAGHAGRARTPGPHDFMERQDHASKWLHPSDLRISRTCRAARGITKGSLSEHPAPSHSFYAASDISATAT
jgi:hypothetical protein